MKTITSKTKRGKQVNFIPEVFNSYTATGKVRSFKAPYAFNAYHSRLSSPKKVKLIPGESINESQYFFLRRYTSNFYVLDIFGALVSAASAALGGTTIGIINKKFIKPLEEMEKISKKYLENEHIAKALQNTYDRIIRDWINIPLLYMDPDGTSKITSESEYNDKLAKYKSSSFAPYKEMYSFYANFNWSKVGLSKEYESLMYQYSSEVKKAWANYYETIFGKTVGSDSAVSINDVLTTGNVKLASWLTIAGCACLGLSTCLLIVDSYKHTSMKLEMGEANVPQYNDDETEWETFQKGLYGPNITQVKVGDQFRLAEDLMWTGLFEPDETTSIYDIAGKMAWLVGLLTAISVISSLVGCGYAVKTVINSVNLLKNPKSGVLDDKFPYIVDPSDDIANYLRKK